VFVGPGSSLFDFTTFFIMLYVFNCWNTSTPEAAAHSTRLFQTGWFVESLLTQTVIIHIIRTNRIPFLQSWPSWPLLVMSAIIMAIGIAIPFTVFGDNLGFIPLPPFYWQLLGLTLSWRHRVDSDGENVVAAAQITDLKRRADEPVASIFIYCV